MRLRHGSTAPTVYLTRDSADRFAEHQGELLCPHPAVVRKFAGAALAQKKSQSCASASLLLLLPLTKTSSPLSCIVSVWFLQGTRWSRARSTLKFYRHESRWALSHIRQHVGVASRQPFDIAGLEFSRHRAHAVDVAAYFEIGDRDQQMRTVVMVAGYDRARFKVDFGHAHSIFHKKNFAAAARKSLFATFLRPMGRRLPQSFILHQLNRHIAKGLVRKIPCDVGKVSWHETGLTVTELEVHGGLAFDFVRDMSIAE